MVVCAAPPAQQIEELIRLAQSDGWSVCVIPSPAAAEWLDLAALAEATGHPVCARARRPDEPKLPPADAVAVAPATFNTINKCAAGINDNAALGVVNEAAGLGIPVVVAPYVKATLAAHPSFARALGELAAFGFTILANNTIQPPEGTVTFVWRPVLEALSEMDPRTPLTSAIPSGQGVRRS
ncbi:flavoprotein [Pseudofrankia sp. BMG5.37]|uniref:flavoprotein n=1 Tax=Pseudofrankia sp. BMG5.37 TaxID=3050035 RepID=UPI0028954200|nr:flavoprotein [Pseudofrankia sp. BMG5.37]MDT3443574.1 flavoprotein [Pseudofrankia sp. BMG5.37]